MSWQPVSFLGVAGAFSSLSVRGWPAMVEFAWAAAAAFIGAAAGWAIWTRPPAAIPLARLAIAAGAIRELQRLTWTALPSDVIPGTRGWVAAIVCLASAAMLAATRASHLTRS